MLEWNSTTVNRISLGVLLFIATLPAGIFMATKSDSGGYWSGWGEALPAVETRSQDSPSGTYAQWGKVEIALTGPNSVGMSENNNPFEIEVFVRFESPSGVQYTVPAFYEGNGNGGLNGNVWKVRFTPDESGTWQYLSMSDVASLNGESGSFEVVAPVGCTSYEPGALPNFNCTGRLQAVNQHYLAFADGTYWLKGGSDEPEDFLAPGQTVGFASKAAAIDYLAANGVNSMYIMLHNVGGDRNNVWPWVGSTESEARNNDTHFDISKLAEWEAIFSYIQDKGIVLHLVLEDDSGWTGFDRPLYYREMVARFGHHNGLYWNISEEYNENYSASDVRLFAEHLSMLDAYDRPLTVHHQGDTGNWEPFVGNADFDLTSFQTARETQNDLAVAWFELANMTIPTLVLSFDETGRVDSGDRGIARQIVWSVYLGGANYEMLTAPLSDYRDFGEHFADMHRARTFIESLPFYRMQPVNGLIAGGDGYLFARPGLVYAAYLPAGGQIAIDLSTTGSIFDVEWFNPRSGGTQAAGETSGGATRSFTAPDNGDWVLLLNRISGGNLEPFAVNGAVRAGADAETSISLTYFDEDGPGPFTFTVIDGPEHGSLTGSGATRTYQPDAGFTGTDSFTWRVHDGLAASNVATIVLHVDENGDASNRPPIAETRIISVAPESTAFIQLAYSDPDNQPGPYTVEIYRAPRNGSLDGANNDWTYTPDPGFVGFDFFQWRVHDGEDYSNIALVMIAVGVDFDHSHLPVIARMR